MQIKTVYKRASEYYKRFDEEVNELLEQGWILKERYLTEPHTDSFVPMLYAELEKPDEEDLSKESGNEGPDKRTTLAPDQTLIDLDPDIEDLIEISRGTTTVQDYLNTIIPLGVACAQRFKGKMEEAVYQILYGDFLDKDDLDHKEENI